MSNVTRTWTTDPLPKFHILAPKSVNDRLPFHKIAEEHGIDVMISSIWVHDFDADLITREIYWIFNSNEDMIKFALITSEAG